MTNPPQASLHGAAIGAVQPETIRREMSEHRAAVALHHLLGGLCAKLIGARVRGMFVAMAGKLARDVVARRLPGAVTAAEWAAFIHDMSCEPRLDARFLTQARHITALLRDGVVAPGLILETDRAGASIRAGIVAALLWHWQPFSEEAEARDGDQTVPDMGDLASRARQVLHGIVACPTQEAIGNYLDRSISSTDVGAMAMTVKPFMEMLHGARRLVDDPGSFAVR
jgi:hypothetical protein